MAKKAKAPKKAHRIKLLLYATSGWGKTTGMAQVFQDASPVLLDLEGGAEPYTEWMESIGVAVWPALTLEDFHDKLKWLLSEKHSYHTVIVDPITKLYEFGQEKWAEVFRRQALRRGDNEKAETESWGLDFWGKVKSEQKRLLNLLFRLEMNVVATSHAKPQYDKTSGSLEVKGETFDAMRGIDYMFDIILRGARDDHDHRFCKVEKERVPPGKNIFKEGLFPWEIEEARQWLSPIVSTQEDAHPTAFATKEEIDELERLIDVLNVEAEVIAKWKQKAKAAEFSEFTAEQIHGCLDLLNSRLVPKEAAS